ncbi:putative leader peptide [Antrihabitans sp. YC2-6]
MTTGGWQRRYVDLCRTSTSTCLSS